MGRKNLPGLVIFTAIGDKVKKQRKTCKKLPVPLRRALITLINYLRAQKINTQAKVKIIQDGPGTTVFDADHAQKNGTRLLPLRL